MQEIREIERQPGGGVIERIDRLIGFESDNLREAFEVRRKAALKRSEQTGNKVEIRETRRIGRNDPCPCGSGSKFKKCCGRTLRITDERVK